MPSKPGWAITHYCSACNDPKGSMKGNHENILQPGDCAINNGHGFKFGRYIKIGGMNLRVADHCGKMNTVDVWQGKREKCTCNYKATGQTISWEE
jgi:hypothetical protein